MRDFLPALFIAALLAFSCSSEKESEGISGRYIGTQTFGIGQISSPMALQLRQQGAMISGTVTPPFQTAEAGIQNGRVEGNSLRFDARYGGLTYHYEAMLQEDRIQGGFGPLGCVMQSSGEPCVTDSDGGFNLTKQ